MVKFTSTNQQTNYHKIKKNDVQVTTKYNNKQNVIKNVWNTIKNKTLENLSTKVWNINNRHTQLQELKKLYSPIRITCSN